MSLLERPWPRRSRTSRSRAVRVSESSSAEAAGSWSNLSVTALGSTIRPCPAAAIAAASSSGGASGGTTPQPLSCIERSLETAWSSSEIKTSACVPSSATAKEASSSSSSLASSTTSASESSEESVGEEASPTTRTSVPSAFASIERSPARVTGAGATTNARVGVTRRAPGLQVHVHDRDLTAAHQTQADSLPGAGNVVEQGFHVAGRATVHAEQHVAYEEAGSVGGTPSFEGGDHETR